MKRSETEERRFSVQPRTNRRTRVDGFFLFDARTRAHRWKRAFVLFATIQKRRFKMTFRKGEKGA